jgi:oxaloacetate decarboxylase alpha subunit
VFDCCLRYLNEDPWERLRKLRKAMPNTKLQMLLRGQNLLGYKHYPDEVVRMFVDKSVDNGIDIIRIFDALNDLRNIEVAANEAIKKGATVSGTLSYTQSPVHTLDAFAKLAKELENMGVQSICVKDMAGTMSPYEAQELIGAIKKEVKVPVVLHTHCTTGLAYMTYLKAAEAGCDVIDTATSCFSGGTSQPATETLNFAFKQLGYDTGLNDAVLKEVNDFFKPIRDEYIANGGLNPKMMATDTDALNYKVPGGMLSNLVAQLKAQNAMDKFEQVLLETPKVRADMGYPPLVTPMSQMVGVQATNNVLAGERYKNVSKEVKSYCLGEYGKTPAPINPEVLSKVLGDEKPIEGRYADTLEPIFDKTKADLEGIAKSDEDVLSYIAFPAVTEKFFAARKAEEEKIVKYTISPMD